MSIVTGQGRVSEPPSPSPVSLRITGVDKRFPGVHALKQVTFEAVAGEIHGVVGENGAGKSTLMAVTSGALAADAGTVEIGGVRLDRPHPEAARELGLAIAYQEPALVPDLTVTENVMLALSPAKRADIDDPALWVGGLLRTWRPSEVLSGSDHVRDLTPDARFVVEIARALAEDPNVLVLDEPTEHLPAKDVEQLFTCCRELAARGGTVIYISHRIAEVKEIADRITVLCDGSVRATMPSGTATESDIIACIVGRDLGSRFPAKASSLGPVRLQLRDLRGGSLDGATLAVRESEIVGLAGIEGQGQSEILRAVVGLARTTGDVVVDDTAVSRPSPAAARRAGVAYVPSDRHAEGVFSGLTVRENLTAGSLADTARGGFVRSSLERSAARRSRDELGIKAATLEVDIDTLSGGNQQKTVLARALMGRPTVLLADEPTQGVDVGARADIYDILRSSAQAGASVLVTSSDSAELVGLCDRVLVVSRGKIITELAGEDLSEQAVRHAVLTSTASRDLTTSPRRSRLAGLLGSDRVPALVLLFAVVALAAWGTSSNPRYVAEANITSILSLFAILAFVALGQQMVMLTAGMDLSVGPLMGFLVVVASFKLSDDRTVLGLVLGVPFLVLAVLAVGLLNFVLVRHLRINPMIATLVTYMALQGGSLILRPQPGGSMSGDLTDLVGATVGPVPIAAIVAVVVGVALDLALKRARWGWRLRAVGSDPEAARRSGVHVARSMFGAYLGCAALVGIGAVLLMGQVGSGDANAGLNYTFASIAAVVLGGASVFGGRGSFVAALTGALLVVQINTVALFVGLSDAWQLYLLGGLTLLAAGFYSQVRRSA